MKNNIKKAVWEVFVAGEAFSIEKCEREDLLQSSFGRGALMSVAGLRKNLQHIARDHCRVAPGVFVNGVFQLTI